MAAQSILECNTTVETSMTWSAYTVAIVKDPASQTGLIEQLTEIRINDTVPTYTSSLINIPPLTFDHGLHKLEFKLEIETGVPELPLFKKAYTYVNITKSPLIPGFIKGSVAKVTRGWGQVLKLDGRTFSIDPDDPSDKEFNFTWWCRRLDGPDGPEEFEPMLLDTDGDGVDEIFPLLTPGTQQRIPQPRDPIIINPPEGCFGDGPGPVKVVGPRLSLNTSSLVTYAQVYELSVVVQKDVRYSQVKIELDVGVIPAPIVEIECAAAGLCFPTFGGIFVNPTSRLAMRSLCTEECLGGEMTYNWKLNFCNAKVKPEWCPHRLRTLSCDEDLMTTTTTTTTTSTTTTEEVKILPDPVPIKTTTYTDNATDITYIAASSNGSILVSYEDGKSRRRKRQLAVELGESGVVAAEEDYGPVELIPAKIPTGCQTVFTAGLDQNEFTLSTDYFSMNRKLKEFEIELNVTRCIKGTRKTSCSSGITTVAVKVNDPPTEGTCSIVNLGKSEVRDYLNPGYNTALLDIFHIRCLAWKDPNAHTITKYVFKGKCLNPKILSNDPICSCGSDSSWK